MKCTEKEWEYCREEKRGCKGCHYNEQKTNEKPETKKED
jgi:hypothetical protein